MAPCIDPDLMERSLCMPPISSLSLLVSCMQDPIPLQSVLIVVFATLSMYPLKSIGVSAERVSEQERVRGRRCTHRTLG